MSSPPSYKAKEPETYTAAFSDFLSCFPQFFSTVSWNHNFFYFVCACSEHSSTACKHKRFWVCFYSLSPSFLKIWWLTSWVITYSQLKDKKDADEILRMSKHRHIESRKLRPTEEHCLLLQCGVVWYNTLCFPWFMNDHLTCLLSPLDLN